jgi:hypothetical protein
MSGAAFNRGGSKQKDCILAVYGARMGTGYDVWRWRDET